MVKVDIRDDRAFVSGPTIGEAPLNAMSDGYLTMAGWVFDLIARYVDRAQRKRWPVTDKFNLRMEGLVLLDEVDLPLGRARPACGIDPHGAALGRRVHPGPVARVSGGGRAVALGFWALTKGSLYCNARSPRDAAVA